MNKDQQLPHDLAHRLRLMDVLDRITQISLANENMGDVLRDVLDFVLEVFNADRAWFLYPCDPDVPFWGVPMERTRPEWPGLSVLGEKVAMNSDLSEIFSELLRVNGTIQYGPHTEHPIPHSIVEHFSVKSQLMIALRPKIGNSWVFGLHHCVSEVIHDEEDMHLFTAIAQRISDFLSGLILVEQLRESEERWKFALEGAGDGIWDWNPQTDEALFSKHWKEMVGYAEHEFPDTGAAWVEHLHPDDKDRVLSAVQEYFAGKQPFYVVEFRMRCKDGSWKWILARGKLVNRDADGNPLRMIGTHTDITERKQAEIALNKESEKYLALLRNASDGIHILDTDGNIIEVSDSFCSMLGYRRDEMIGMNVSQWEANLSGTELTRQVRDQYAKQSRSQFETRHRRKDGTIFDVEVSGLPLELGGKPVLFNSSRDTTARKKAEAEMRIAATAFESQEGMMVTDANNMILRVNQAFTGVTGYTHEEIIGKKANILNSGRHDANFFAAMWESLNNTDAWKGEIQNRRKNGEIYTEYLNITAVKDPRGTVINYVAMFTDLTAINAATDKIKQLAFYDQLTALPNRRLLMDRLQQSLASSARSGQKGALLFIDLDNFKDINDTLGHDIGDLLLQRTAQRLESSLRKSDTVARLGGDEFVVMLEGLSEHVLEAAAQTKTVGEKILATLGQLYQLATHKYHSTSSIGATIFSDHGQSAEELLKQADIAMYQAKKAGRNTLRFFDPQMQVSITARVSLESELRKALENQQFQLHYQIQVDSSHRPLGAEALIRWIHPLRGMVSPAQFIPLAEETGLILPIGLWVLETACAQLKAWEQDALTRDLVLAVNVSAKQFHQADFVAQVQAVVQHHAINPMLLKLELTEGMLLENIEDTIATMNALKEIGVQFSLDDFGTGYSSLQYLKRLPLDQLKIDQSFVRDIAIDSSDKAIVHTIIAMAQSLNLNVIAEGVETEEQRQFLLENGCSHYQGYLFSKPVPVEQFEALLKRG
jgi:diguanylate cyclase (GGDEF)-like protein/PAS domain S-box-containing protein